MKIINFRSGLCFIFLLSPLIIFLLIISALSNLPPEWRRVHDDIEYPEITLSELELFEPAVSLSNDINWESKLNEPPFLNVSRSMSGRRSTVEYVLGVPTVYRPGINYLAETLQQLIEYMDENDHAKCLFVVYIGETNRSIVQKIWQSISQTFGQHIDDGLIEIIWPPIDYYQDLQALKTTLNDEPVRVRWRTKQTLDYVYLMRYAQSRGTYYLQLEDDVQPNKGYFDYIHKFTELHTNFRLNMQRKWIVLSFSQLGFIGKLLHTDELRPFLTYAQLFSANQPIDWLLSSYVKLRCCRWDGFRGKKCMEDYASQFIIADQTQFQHKGIKSSLRNKKQQLKDEQIAQDAARQRMHHLRQPFNLIASHKHNLLSHNLYLQKGETYFWGYLPHVSSIVQYMSDHQYDNIQILFRTSAQNSAAANISEVVIDVVPKVMSLNDTESQNCGFIFSYIFGGKSMLPILMYFYVNERHGPNGSVEQNWFRRFVWNGSSRLMSPNWIPPICFLTFFQFWSGIHFT